MKEFQKSWKPDRPFSIEKQRRRLNEIYQTELTQQAKYGRFLSDMTEPDGRPSLGVFRPSEYTQLRQTLNNLNCQRNKFDRLFDQIQELLKEYDEVSPVGPTITDHLKRPIELPSTSDTVTIVLPDIIELDQNESSDSDEWVRQPLRSSPPNFRF